MTNFLEAAISTGITVVKFDILNFHLETIYNSKKKWKKEKKEALCQSHVCIYELEPEGSVDGKGKLLMWMSNTLGPPWADL